jgi:hypothetical protein
MNDYFGYFVVQHQLRHRREELGGGQRPPARPSADSTPGRAFALRAGTAATLRRIADRLEPDSRRARYEAGR